MPPLPLVHSGTLRTDLLDRPSMPSSALEHVLETAAEVEAALCEGAALLVSDNVKSEVLLNIELEMEDEEGVPGEDTFVDFSMPEYLLWLTTTKPRPRPELGWDGPRPPMKSRP